MKRILVFPLFIISIISTHAQLEKNFDNNKLDLTRKILYITEIKDAHSSNGEIIKKSGDSVFKEATKQLKKITIVSRSNCEYTIRTKILAWENNPTQWTFEPNYLEISMEVYDDNENLIREASNSLFSPTLMIGTRSPSKLIPKTIKSLFKELFKQ